MPTGSAGDIVHGFESLDGYLGPHPYFGAVVGRYANRIGGAKFTLDGHEYHLSKNDGANSLHGGFKGFDKVLVASRSERRLVKPPLPEHGW